LTIISRKNSPNIIIGWNYGSFNDKNISVYSYRDGYLESLVTEKYSEAIISDIDDDSLDELMIVTSSTGNGRAYAKLIRSSGSEISVTDQVFLAENVTAFSRSRWQIMLPAKSAVCGYGIDEASYSTAVWRTT
jgi:hypothetical protein